MRYLILLVFGAIFPAFLAAQATGPFFSTFTAERGNVLAPAADGRLWLGGMLDERVLIVKLSPGGNIIERHSIGFQGTSLDADHLTDLFEDGDGMLVGCGYFELDNAGRGFAFRYNPASRKMVWSQIVRSDLNFVHGITEIGPGGDFILYGNPHTFAREEAEMVRLSRATGQIVPGRAKRFSLGTEDGITQAVYHKGALYTCGRFTNDGGFNNDLSRMRHALCKVDTATLQPVWSRIGPLPTASPARLYGRDLIIDNEAIVSTLSGDATGPDLFSSTIFLQKNDLNGNLLWVRQYDLPEWNGEFAEEVISLPDGYLLYGHDLLSDTSRLFLLKTDKTGAPLGALKIDVDYNEDFPYVPARSKILRLGDALFFTAMSQNGVGQTQGILGKIDLNAWDDDSCGFYTKTPVHLVAMPAPVSEAVVPAVAASPATLEGANVSLTMPDLTVNKTCGAGGTCPALPDLRLRLDSFTCHNGDPRLHYSFCNEGGQVYEGSAFFGLYDKNPFTENAKLVTYVIHTGESIQPGDCSNWTIGSNLLPPNDFLLDTFPNLYAVIGMHPNMPIPVPLGSFPFPPNSPECGYVNNLDSIVVPEQICGACEHPTTFVKKLGSPQRSERVFGMCTSVDGNVYIAGRQGDNPMIAKFTPLGAPVWVRNFPGYPLVPTEWSEIIEDSEGKLVICGTQGDSPSTRYMIVVRYDPMADKMVWFRAYPGHRAVASGILEKTLGGNFLLVSNSQEIVGGMLKTRSELRELDRATGDVVPALSVRYLGEPNIRLEHIAMNLGNLYATGSWQTGQQQPLSPIFAKISATTGQPDWVLATNPDTTAITAKVTSPGCLVIDGDFVLIAGIDDIAPGGAGNNNFLYLEKRRVDGTLLWMKRYDIQLYPEDVIMLDNAYAVFGFFSTTNKWGMVKVDEQGNVLIAKTLEAGPALSSFSFTPNRQNQMLRTGPDILMCDHTQDGAGDNDLLLLRTDANFGLDDNCSLLQNIQVSAADLPARSLPVVMETVPAQDAAFTLAEVFQADSLPVSKLCPECLPATCSDVAFSVNTIFCSADSAYFYNARVCNTGDAPFSGPFEVTFFDKNPLIEAALPVWSVVVNTLVEPGQCVELSWPLPGPASQYAKLYSLAGVGSNVATPLDPGSFPFSQGFAECTYGNNLDSFVVRLPVCDDCQYPSTFFKTMGRADRSEQGYSLCTASDGNVYLAGRQGSNPMIAKMTPNGEMIWVRNFPAGTVFETVELVEIFEDSEGKLVLCGTEGLSPNTRIAVAMRYDPAADQVLWFRQYPELNPQAMGIFEKTPGGNLILYGFSDELFPGGPPFGSYYKARSEVWEIDRATGEVVPALATLFAGDPSVYFQDMAPHNGSLYAVGGWSNNNQGRMMLAKLSATDGTPEWIQGAIPDTTQATQFIGFDHVLVDSGQLVIVGSGVLNINTPAQVTLVYLSKYALDGSLLWIKGYEIALYVEDIVALPDGYALFGRMEGNSWGIMKTDKDGNLLVAKKISLPVPPGFASGSYRQNQLLRLPKHLLMADDYKAAVFNDIVLIKTDYNFNLDDSCSLLETLLPVTRVQPARTEPIVTPFQPYPVQAVTVQTTFQADSLNARQWCPQCPCLDKPDITYHVDSVYCSATGGILAGIRICNLGQVSPSTGFNLTFYNKNPLTEAATPLYSMFVADKPGFADCIRYALPLDFGAPQQSKIYTLVGLWSDVQTPVSPDDFPFPNGFAECNYANNLDSFDLKLPDPVKPSLGPDRSICDGQAATLDAGGGYLQYKWLDGGSNARTYTVNAAGDYAVEVTDACGRKLRDTVRVTVLAYPKRNETLLLLPGDTVVIGGTAYSGPGMVIDTVPASGGGCDTVVTYTLLLDTLYCPEPAAFIKTYDKPGKRNQGGVLLAASDGTFYLGGDSDAQPFLIKTDSNGAVLWARSFEFIPGGSNQELTALVEDSDGMLLGCGSRGGSNTSKVAYVFRYDPVANHLLWIQHTPATTTDIKAYAVVEEVPGGAVILSTGRRAIPGISDAELWRFDRASGVLLNGKTQRFAFPGSGYFKSIAVRSGVLYGTGEFAASVPTAGRSRHGLAKVDLTNGNVLWSTAGHVDTAVAASLAGQDLIVENDTVVSLYYGRETSPNGPAAVFLQKTAPDGKVLWVRRFEGFSEDNGVALTLVALPSGYGFAVLTGVFDISLIFIKTDRDGHLLWAKTLPDAGFTNAGDRGAQMLAARGDYLYFVNSTFDDLGKPTKVLLGKLDKNGNIEGNCTLKDAQLNVSDVSGPLSQPIGLMPGSPLRVMESLPVPLTGMALPLIPLTACADCIPCTPIALTKTIPFYPGDTVVINSVAYTQPGTVVQNLVSSQGCDSVVTIILEQLITVVHVQCPANFSVSLPLNQPAVPVSYTLPAATTDCPDPAIVLKRLQGPPSGAAFPQGVTTVCYEAENTCGVRDSCCFTVTVLPSDVQPCDVKTPPGCLQYELLDIRFDALGQRRYRVRVTNTCAGHLQYVYLQLPKGVTAVSPADGSIYANTANHSYTVRQPNASPFYSIRYKVLAGGLNNGQSDVFEYTLPQQAAPDYIHVAARLVDGTGSETHLNTFDCPVQPYLPLPIAAQRADTDTPATNFPVAISLRPNPNDGHFYLDLRSWTEEPVYVQVLNARGQRVLERCCGGAGEWLEMDLPDDLVDGLYYLSVRGDDGQQAAVRFVLAR